MSAAPAKGEPDAGGESIQMSEIDVGEDNQATPSPGTSDATNLGAAHVGGGARARCPHVCMAPPHSPRRAGSHAGCFFFLCLRTP